MNRRSFLQGIASCAAAAAGVVTAGCSASLVSAFNFRLALSFRVGNEIKQGESVLSTEIYDRGNLRVAEVQKFFALTWGEAAVVDLGNSLVFALLHPPAGMIGFSALFPHRELGRFMKDPPLSDNEFLIRLKSLRGPFALQTPNLPIFMRFRDLNDPRSAEQVSSSQLGEALGSDVVFAGATIGVTDNQRTTGVLAKRIPWWTNHTGRLNPPDPQSRPLPITQQPFSSRLSHFNFEFDGARS